MNVQFDQCDLVSFDVFDTLLVRTYLTPTDVFRHLEEESGEAGFAEARRRADFESIIKLRPSGREATMDDAYALLPAQFQRLKDRELELERAGLRANSETVAIWRRAGELGKKRVIASDMYLPRSFLEEVLRANGIDGWDGFYLSCDCGVRKSTGQMFERILGDFGLPPERMLHVGDNPQSDVAMPKRLGIAVRKVDAVVESVCAEHPFLKRFLEADDSLAARCLVAALCLAWHNYAHAHPQPPYWAHAGGFLGGVMGAAYGGFLAREARERKIDRLLFVARDGFALEKIFTAVEPGIRTHYVYAPRAVLYSRDPGLHFEYAAYIAGFGIRADETVAVVDAVTLQCSGRRLIAEALKRPVVGFSFLALAKQEQNFEFLYSPRGNIRWHNLVETLLMANEPPIQAVIGGRPVYRTPVPDEERNRMAVFAESVEAAVELARFLLTNRIEVSREALLDFIDAFLDSMTEEDQIRFSTVKNEVDPHTSRYEPILSPPHWTVRWQKILGIPLYRRHYGREGLRIVLRDYLFGFIKFRQLEEEL